MFPLTVALISALALGMTSNSSRYISVLALSALSFLYPFSVLVLLALAGGVFLYLRK